jgi:hypothetical protein
VYSWLGYDLNIDCAMKAANDLFLDYRKAERENGLITNLNADVID